MQKSADVKSGYIIFKQQRSIYGHLWFIFWTGVLNGMQGCNSRTKLETHILVNNYWEICVLKLRLGGDIFIVWCLYFRIHNSTEMLIDYVKYTLQMWNFQTRANENGRKRPFLCSQQSRNHFIVSTFLLASSIVHKLHLSQSRSSGDLAKYLGQMIFERVAKAFVQDRIANWIGCTVCKRYYVTERH